MERTVRTPRCPHGIVLHAEVVPTTSPLSAASPFLDHIRRGRLSYITAECAEMRTDRGKAMIVHRSAAREHERAGRTTARIYPPPSHPRSRMQRTLSMPDAEGDLGQSADRCKTRIRCLERSRLPRVDRACSSVTRTGSLAPQQTTAHHRDRGERS